MAHTHHYTSSLVQYQSQIFEGSKGYRTPTSTYLVPPTDSVVRATQDKVEPSHISISSSPLSDYPTESIDTESVNNPENPTPAPSRALLERPEPLRRFEAVKASIASQRQARDESIVPCTPVDEPNSPDLEYTLLHAPEIIKDSFAHSSDVGSDSALKDDYRMNEVIPVARQSNALTHRTAKATSAASSEKVSRFPWHKQDDRASSKVITEEELEELAIYNPPQDERSRSPTPKKIRGKNAKTSTKTKNPAKAKPRAQQTEGRSKKTTISKTKSNIARAEDSQAAEESAAPRRRTRVKCTSNARTSNQSELNPQSGRRRKPPLYKSEAIVRDSSSDPSQHPNLMSVEAVESQAMEEGAAGIHLNELPNESYEDFERQITDLPEAHIDFLETIRISGEMQPYSREVDEKKTHTTSIVCAPPDTAVKLASNVKSAKVKTMKHIQNLQPDPSTLTSAQDRSLSGRSSDEDTTQRDPDTNDGTTVVDHLFAMLPASTRRPPSLAHKSPHRVIDSPPSAQCRSWVEAEPPAATLSPPTRLPDASGSPLVETAPQNSSINSKRTLPRLTLTHPMVVAHVEPILLIQQPSQTESKTDKPKLANRFSATSNVETKPTAPLLQFSGPMKVASTRPVQPARPPAPRPSIPQLFLPPVAPTIRKPLASLPNPPVVRKCQNGSSDPSPSKRLPQDHLATKRPLPHSKSNSSPKKRLRLAIAESESSSSSSSDDSDIDGPTLVETDWLSSLAPHQQRLYAVLLEVSSRLVRHVTDREDVLVELGEAYRRDGLDVVAAMRAEQDAAIQQYAGAVGEARRRAAEVLEDTLAQVKEEVLALGAGGVENDGKARNAVTELVEKYA